MRVVPEMGNGFAVKTIHVLGDCFVDVTGMLEGYEGVVGGIRLCVSDRRVAEVRAKPTRGRCLLGDVRRLTVYIPVTLPGPVGRI